MESDRALEGLGGSLAAGVEAAADADGWIIGLGDMPFVPAETIRAVRKALEGGATIAAPFDPTGRRGHPVGFSTAFRDALLALAGDAGARGILERNKEAVTRIPLDDARAFTDVDTRDDLMRLRAPISFSKRDEEGA
jgi:molybdenum cofactor cytidylyltransferase